MSINCIVIDDEHPAIRQMEEYISRVPFLKNLASFDNAIEPINFIKSNQVDLIFLDIEMEDFTGLQFIKSLSARPKIILTTAYDQYAIEAFNLNVTDYLLKPIAFERFLQAVDKVFDFHQQNTGSENPDFKKDYIFIKTEYRLQRVDFKDILFVEGMSEYIRIHTVNERIMTLLNLGELETMLPNSRFVRVHKSYIVSIEKIDSIERQRIYIGEEVIPISKTYKEIINKLVR
jgi:DNA-binding LytR/AlgR family response regulator